MVNIRNQTGVSYNLDGVEYTVISVNNECCTV